MKRCPVAQENLPTLTIHIVRHPAAFTKNHFRPSRRIIMF
jgi:hypothetical protein